MIVELEPLIDKVWRHCEGASNRGRTVTLKMKSARVARSIIERETRFDRRVGSSRKL
jgi:hypothetical protein